MKTCFKILVFNLLHVLVIAPLLVFATLAAIALLILPSDALDLHSLWFGYVSACFLLGWLARCFQLRAPFLPATLVALWILFRIGLFEGDLGLGCFDGNLEFLLFVPLCWAGFFVPYPARRKGLWDISMPWISRAPILVSTVSISLSLGSLWILDGIQLGWVHASDARIMSETRGIFLDAFVEALENGKDSIRIDDRDFSVYGMTSGGFYVRKGEIPLEGTPSDTLVMIYDESRTIRTGGSLYSRRVRRMHTGVSLGGGGVRLTVEEFEALDLSDFMYRPLSAPTGNEEDEARSYK